MSLADLGALLNVLVVLVAIYLLLSLLCSTLREAIAAKAGSRGQLLRQRLAEMLTPAGAAAILGSPVIRGLAPSGMTPTYIPSLEFATAVVSILKERGDLAVGAMHPALKVFYDEAGGDLAKFQTRVAVWFDHAMDRLSGSYKRQNQVWMFLIGLAFATAFNIDSIHLVGALWADRAKLDPVVDQIAAVQEQIKQAEQGQAPNQPAPGTADIWRTKIESDPAFRDSLAKALAGLPTDAMQPIIGWQIPNDLAGFWDAIGKAYTNVRAALGSHQGWLKLLGWLITAMAVIPGAQFWFDRLGDALALRATGRKPLTLAELAKGAPAPSGTGQD